MKYIALIYLLLTSTSYAADLWFVDHYDLKSCYRASAHACEFNTDEYNKCVEAKDKICLDTYDTDDKKAATDKLIAN